MSLGDADRPYSPELVRSHLPAGGRSLLLPSFFPAISGVKTNLTTSDYLQVLCTLHHPQFLVSAYDIYHSSPDEREAIYRLIKTANEQGVSILLDSGNYERYWLRDDTWIPENFWSVLAEGLWPLSFSFDSYSATDDPIVVTNLIEESLFQDQMRTSKTTILPVIHAPSELLPDVARLVVQRLQPLMIAIPERELGEGILARADCIIRVRRAIDETGATSALHLLGTGNPLSILLYSLCGADSFDGLEWCQTTVDHDTALLYHFQQREFFRTQSRFASLEEIPYTYATLGHNLLFYEMWLTRIRQALRNGSALDLAARYLPQRVADLLRNNLPSLGR